MKIVFVSYSYWPPDFGGELHITLELLRSLAARGWKVSALTSGRPGFPARHWDEGIEVWRSPVVGNHRLARLLRRFVFWLWALINLSRMNYDVIHLGNIPGIDPVTSAVMAQSFCRIAKMRGVRSVAMHTIADKEDVSFEGRGWEGLWRRAFFSRLDRIVAVSPSLYSGIAKYFGTRTRLIPCGVRDDIFVPNVQARQTLRAERGLANQNVVFLFMGSVGRRKGFDLLAQAFAELTIDHPEWRLWIVGPYTRKESQNLDESEAAEVTRTLQGLEDRIVFWGRVDDRQILSHILAAGDIFVFPSRREGYGIAPVLAMATGLPVIIARIPGVTDVASVEEETGLYVTPGDLASLKTAMQRLGTNAKLRRELGARAAERIRENFGWQKYIDTWADLYAGKNGSNE